MLHYHQHCRDAHRSIKTRAAHCACVHISYEKKKHVAFPFLQAKGHASGYRMDQSKQGLVVVNVVLTCACVCPVKQLLPVPMVVCVLLYSCHAKTRFGGTHSFAISSSLFHGCGGGLVCWCPSPFCYVVPFVPLGCWTFHSLTSQQQWRILRAVPVLTRG